MVNVNILDVIKEEKSNSHLVLLGDKEGRMLPIFIGASEAIAIAAGLKKSQFPRPMTYDMICNLLKEAYVSVLAVDISSLQQSTFYATIRFRSNDVDGQVDARPSDAMAIAVRTDAPIRVSEEVIGAAAIKGPEAGSSLKGMVAMMEYVNEKMKQLASEKGWSVPDILPDTSEIKVKSLLSEK